MQHLTILNFKKYWYVRIWEPKTIRIVQAIRPFQRHPHFILPSARKNWISWLKSRSFFGCGIISYNKLVCPELFEITSRGLRWIRKIAHFLYIPTSIRSHPKTGRDTNAGFVPLTTLRNDIMLNLSSQSHLPSHESIFLCLNSYNFNAH